tara:strand:+ start:144 stop:311 length:168 start_codon:yes stop_codon:yes gene_type:complete
MLTIIKENGEVLIIPLYYNFDDVDIEDFIVSKLNLNLGNIVWSIAKTITIKEMPK